MFVIRTYSESAHIGSIITVVTVPLALKIALKLLVARWADNRRAMRRIQENIREQQKIWYS